MVPTDIIMWTLGAIAGVLGAIYVALQIFVFLIEKGNVLKGCITDETKRNLKKYGIILLIVTISIFSIIGVYVLMTRPSVHIYSPDNGAVVSMEEQITGVAKNIPKGSTVWVVIRVEKRYFPQRDFKIDKDGYWTCDARFGGVNDDDRKDFDVIALVADENANSVFVEKSGFTVLPVGAKEYERITVTRETKTAFSTSTPTQQPIPTLTPVVPFITITFPVNNAADVDMWEWVNGTSQNIPNG
ncbi:MAG: hypothetical protein LBE70_05310, partial [Nitrososphaerota archaeon]|nr:hypothetical protein [Nitrososphaerota archaeon]